MATLRAVDVCIWPSEVGANCVQSSFGLAQEPGPLLRKVPNPKSLKPKPKGLAVNPLNPTDAIFYQNTPDSLRFPANPFGFRLRRLGLGNLLRSRPRSFANPTQSRRPVTPT